MFQGVPAFTQAIDLWIKDLGKEQFLNAVSKYNAHYIPPGIVGNNPPTLASAELRGFDLVTTCQGLGTIEDELKEALTIQLKDITLKILPLSRIIKSKETANREKDRAVLPMLRAALEAQK